MNLITERMTLKEITEEDTFLVVQLRSDPKVYRLFKNPHLLTESEHLAWLRNSYALNTNRIDFIARQRENDIPIGIFGIARDIEGAQEVEISYLLDPTQKGRGYAGEAVAALMEWARQNWHSKVAKAVIHPHNNASLQFAARGGFCYDKRVEGFDVYRKTL